MNEPDEKTPTIVVKAGNPVLVLVLLVLIAAGAFLGGMLFEREKPVPATGAPAIAHTTMSVGDSLAPTGLIVVTAQGKIYYVGRSSPKGKPDQPLSWHATPLGPENDPRDR